MTKVYLIVVLLLGGCASNSGVVPIGKDTFMVSRQAATGFSGSGTLKAEAFQEADRYCRSNGKLLQVVSTYEAKPPYILANFPKAEIQFMCLDPKDAELNRPKLRKEADSVVEIKEGNENTDDIYAELIKLDDLREKGILTEEEFVEQKKKVLRK
jgi:hypothetical protein